MHCCFVLDSQLSVCPQNQARGKEPGISAQIPVGKLGRQSPGCVQCWQQVLSPQFVCWEPAVAPWQSGCWDHQYCFSCQKPLIPSPCCSDWNVHLWPYTKSLKTGLGAGSHCSKQLHVPAAQDAQQARTEWLSLSFGSLSHHQSRVGKPAALVVSIKYSGY